MNRGTPSELARRLHSIQPRPNDSGHDLTVFRQGVLEPHFEARMPYGLYLSADGAHAQQKRLEVIANNLANVDTVGFKRDLAIFQARYAEETERGLDFQGSKSINDTGGGVFVRETKTDYSLGPLKHTMLPTDMAIDGDGFFAIEKNGETFLTRAGNFRITSEGQWVSQQGYPVLSDAGSPIVVSPDAGPWDITANGGIRQGGAQQNLALLKPESLGDLVKAGENLFRPLSEPQPVPLTQRRIQSGYLEHSGAQPTTEMIAMIETSRAIEANLKMMQTQDEMLSGLVNRVMRT